MASRDRFSGEAAKDAEVKRREGCDSRQFVQRRRPVEVDREMVDDAIDASHVLVRVAARLGAMLSEASS